MILQNGVLNAFDDFKDQNIPVQSYLDARLTGDQEVTGLIPVLFNNIIS